MRLSGSLLLSGFLTLAFIVNCAATSKSVDENNIQPQHSIKKSAQIIIKFRNNIFDPSKTAFVQELSRDARAALSYIRPMSGGAHVFAVEKISDAEQLIKVIQRLSQRPDVLYVQQDRMLRHQKAP
jgi:acetolactate synthase small subunit